LNNYLNIISFDVPYPPNYGGIIDVFFKLKALNQLGVKIILHTYEYGRGEQKELQKYCETVYYYKRNKNLNKVLSKLPFIVNSRINNQLLKKLQSNNYPILFEGLHTTYPLIRNQLNKRQIIVRAHNVEHHYYLGLSRSENSKTKRLYFLTEALKLKKYQPILNSSSHILSISKNDYNYFKKKLRTHIDYIPAFHQNNEINISVGKGDYALYHGDLRVSDNIKACNYLCEIFSLLNYSLIIAGNTNDKLFVNKIKTYPNIKLINQVDNENLNHLIKNAHINILPTFQNTGIKLKLINALFSGRFCLVNNEMVENTGLENLCQIANSKKEFLSKILELKDKSFPETEIIKRKQTLTEFDNLKNAQKIIDLIF